MRYRAAGARTWLEEPLEPLGNDRWAGSFRPAGLGRWQFTIEAWVDRYATLLDELDRKLAAGQTELAGELSEAEALFGPGELDAWREAAREAGRRRTGTARRRWTSRSRSTSSGCARASAPGTSSSPQLGRFQGRPEGAAAAGRARLRRRLPAADPPDRRRRTARAATTPCRRRRAIRAARGRSAGKEGGHDAIHPELGTLKDFDNLVAAARKAGLEIALDFAIQTSPDHPWLTEHPEWFNRRPDGTLKYAENPPKRYQDIYNVNFDSEDWPGLWEALRDVVLHWCRHGVRAYRVDNPHTKSVPFWEWLIAEVRAEFPDTVFFAEAFTRPAMMTTLAKIGFSQSYTYFTWKNTKAELQEFLHQQLEWSAYYRPNFFANTPDILHEYLQQGGRPAFELRLVLAATLSPSYGIYSGFEHFENVPVAHGSEEYLDSEKYEVKQRALDGPLLRLVRRLNEMRRAEPALQRFDNLRLLDTHGEAVFAYSRAPTSRSRRTSTRRARARTSSSFRTASGCPRSSPSATC